MINNTILINLRKSKLFLKICCNSKILFGAIAEKTPNSPSSNNHFLRKYGAKNIRLSPYKKVKEI